MAAIHEQARALGVTRVWLEVIVENTGAFALYEKLGYVVTQDVEVWMLDGAKGDHDAREVPAAEIELPGAARAVAARRRDARALRRRPRPRHRHGRDALPRSARRCSRCGTPASRSRSSARSARTATSTGSTSPRTTRRRHVLRDLGGTVVVRQHEMVLEL